MKHRIKCGCVIEEPNGDDWQIIYCPLHEAAGEMLKALKDVFDMIETGDLLRDIKNDGDPLWTLKMMTFVNRLQKGQQTIAKAERS